MSCDAAKDSSVATYHSQHITRGKRLRTKLKESIKAKKAKASSKVEDDSEDKEKRQAAESAPPQKKKKLSRKEEAQADKNPYSMTTEPLKPVQWDDAQVDESRQNFWNTENEPIDDAEGLRWMVLPLL